MGVIGRADTDSVLTLKQNKRQKLKSLQRRIRSTVHTCQCSAV